MMDAGDIDDCWNHYQALPSLSWKTHRR